MRLITKWLCAFALLLVAGNVSAAKEYEVDQKFTDLSELLSSGTLFSIVNETDGKGLCFGFGDAEQNMYYETFTDMMSSKSYTFKVEAAQGDDVAGYYYLRPYKPNGELNNVWGWGGYFNSQKASDWCCFCLGLNNQNGQDLKDGAVWAIEVNEGKFALKNIGTGKYLKDGAPAKYDDPTYFTFCTLKEKASTDPLAEQKDALEAAITKGKMFNALAYTEATFTALGTAVTNGETALAAADATAESLTTATTAINDAITALALKDGFTSLKDVDFGVFDGWGATAKLTQKLDPAWDLFKATGQSYGDPSVNNRADVSAYDKLYVVAVSGSPRILLNRDADGGQWSETEADSHLIDNTKGGWSAKYFSTENGITTVDLKQLVADKGFAHLTAIKSFDNNVISGLYLYKAPAVVPVDPTVVTWDATTKNYENGTEIGTVAIDEKINAAFDKNTNSNAPKYYTTGEAVRAYGGNTITISGEKVAISKVEFTFGSSDGTNDILADKGTYAEGVWTISENTNIVKFTIGGTTGNRRIVAIKVTYTIDENAAPLPQPVHIANTAETAYTVAQAIELIDAGEALSETVFVKGIISQVDKIQSGAITYWISADGTTEGQQFECYKGKNIDGADFAALEDVEVGAEVIVKGTLTKYGETYEFNQGNELVSYKAPFKPLFADGKYYIYNVGAQKYLAAGANWGTHAAVNATGLDYEIKAADGKYTLDSQVSNGGANHFLNGEWNDGAAFGWTIAKVSDGIFTISNGEKFLTAGENGVVTLADDATAEAAQWSMKTLEARIAELATATAEAPVDATFLIQDADFGRNDLRKSAWKMEASNQNLSGGEDNNGTVGNNNAESYHSTFTLSQTLSKAPAGKYKMTAQGFYRQDDSATEDAPVFYANEKTGTFPAKTGSENSMTDAAKSFSAGQYTIDSIDVTVFEDGLLTIGAKGTATHQWVIFDNFRLTYLGNAIDLTEIIASYNKALEDAKAALAAEENAIVTGEERTALTAAIAANENVAQNQDSLTAAFTALNNATSAFTGAKGAYNALATAKTEKAAMTFAYAAADKKAAAEATLTAEATSAADATAKVEAITKAYRVYAESSALLEGVEGAVNFTDAITNPAAEEAIAEPWAVVKGEGSGGALKILNGEPWTDGSDNSTHKYFDGGDWGAQAWNVALEQTISLPAGKYMLTAKGRASADVDLTLFAGEDTVKMASIGATDGLFNRGWNDASVEFAMTKADSIVIGVRGVTEVVHNWMSFSDFRLVKFPATAEEIALYNAIDALNAIIAVDKTIVTEGQKGAEELANAIATAETAANAKNATVESIAAARAALASAVATFTKANMGKGFAEIAQNQGKDLDTFTRTELVEGEDYNTYTAAGDLNIAIKMVDLDVAGCDYVTVKFAEPVAAGWHLAFWSNQDLVDVPAGATEFKYVFADDPKCGVSAEGVLPQICMMTFFGGFQAPLEAKIVGIYKHKIPVTHTWDFTQWSEETVANLKADAAASKLEGWSDVEKQTDAEAGNEPTETSKDNCFWAAKTMQATEDGELLANGVAIEELKGLVFLPTGLQTRNLAIAVNYPVALSTYEGGAYLWLGGSDKDYFVIPNVKAGTTIKMGVESHKASDARGVRLYMSNDGAKGDQLKDPEGNEVAMPKTYEEQSWKVPGEEGVVNIIVNNSNGCHIYFIDAEIGEAPLETHTFEGYVAIATTLQGDIQGEVTTAAQTVTLEETETDNVVAVTFSGFSSTIPPVNFSEFTFNATVDADETLTTELYEVAANSKVTGTNGTMTLDYTITGNGSATAATTPTFALKLNQNPMMTINVVFAATADEAKAALLKTTGIINIARDAQKNVIFNLNGQKVNKAQKGLYIINGKKVVNK